MNRLDWNQLDDAGRAAALARPEQRSEASVQEAVRAIVGDIRAGGWEAVERHALALDGEAPLCVAVAGPAAEARRTLDAGQIEALESACRNVAEFHRDSLPAEHEVETMPGLSVRKVWRPLDRVGLYVPGGRTPLFSTLLMLALPAQAAGVGEIVVTTPPRPEGGLDPVIALTAELCGITSVWTLGGAQAIAAMGFGAGAIGRVDKICGPGNSYVAEAKKQVASFPGGAAIDMPAGPSELLVIADDSAEPALVAADLLSQAEHDPSAQVLLVTTSIRLADAVERLVADLVITLPRRAIAEASLDFARTIIAESLEQAVDIANLYAPEHLSLAVDDPAPLVGRIRNAGAIFAGHDAAETFGDYLAGSSHVLPTDGAARAWSGISVYSFLKSISVQQATREAARRIAAPAATLARMEGLEAHALAADARMQKVSA